MDKYTQKTKEWLDKRFAEGVREGDYLAHQPIYGYKRGRTEGRDLIRYLRNLSILTKLSYLKFDSFMDIGGAEGYMPNLVKTAFKVDSYTCDLSFEANLRAKEIFNLDSVSIDISNLPFKDEAFDVVLCSEDLEHVANPVQAISELRRITKKALLITTEAVCYDSLERKLRMMLVDLSEDHCDRNWFIAEDFIFMLGDNIDCESTIYDPGIADKGASLDEVKIILSGYAERGILTRGGVGITVLLSKILKDERLKGTIPNLVDIILNTAANTDYKKNNDSDLHPISARLVELLRCPACQSVVDLDKNTLRCSSCGNEYAVKDNVPIMYTHDKDANFLTKKWNTRFLSEFGHDYKHFLKLKKVFEHTTSKPNFLIRIIVCRALKIEKFICNSINVMCQRSLLASVAYFLRVLKKRTLREIYRVINRVRKPVLSDFKIGDTVEFAKDYQALDNQKVFVRQGTFGKIAAISDDKITIRVEGVECPVDLWANTKRGYKPTLMHIKQVKIS